MTEREQAFSVLKGFKIHEVRPYAAPAAVPAAAVAASPPPPLGPLEASWGPGVASASTRSSGRKSRPSRCPSRPGDNLLELNLTSETLSFSKNSGLDP